VRPAGADVGDQKRWPRDFAIAAGADYLVVGDHSRRRESGRSIAALVAEVAAAGK